MLDRCSFKLKYETPLIKMRILGDAKNELVLSLSSSLGLGILLISATLLRDIDSYRAFYFYLAGVFF